MKCKVTRNDLMNTGKRIIKIPYCEMQRTLMWAQKYPNAYMQGKYGWNCDIYELDTIIISTGYRPYGQYIPQSMYRGIEIEIKEKAQILTKQENIQHYAKGLLNMFEKNVNKYFEED